MLGVGRLLGRQLGRFRPRPEAPATYFRLRLHEPGQPRGTVAVTGFGRFGHEGYGKVEPDQYFPHFAYLLHRQDIRVRFLDTPRALRTLPADDDLVIVHIYNEEHDDIDALASLPVPDRALVFNDPRIGRIVGNKVATNRYLGARGISVPRLMQAPQADAATFSNSASDSGAEVRLVPAGAALESDRYNTEFIDTRRSFQGARYHCLVRLVSVGETLIHAIVGLRNVDDDSPSVHPADTPLDPDLIQHFRTRLIDARWPELVQLSTRLGRALGAGFYAHDLVICKETERIYVCETGFKLVLDSYTPHIAPISSALPFEDCLFSAQFARASTEAFLEECRRHGVFV